VEDFNPRKFDVLENDRENGGDESGIKGVRSSVK
jgi:hypothetical protein